MIVVKIIGGLGNQMFQYAAARRLAYKHNTVLKLDIAGFAANECITPRNYELDIFNIQEKFATQEEIEAYKQPHNLVAKIKRKFYENFINLGQPKYILERYFHFDPSILELSDEVYLKGYWQSEKYFKDIENIIRQDFTFKSPSKEKNKILLDKILKSNSVSLHIRRGDYLSNPETKKLYAQPGLGFYNQAVKLISEKIKNPHFFIFSDDIDWAKRNLKLKYPTIYIEHNQGKKAYEDLRLMSKCKHNIIANSSFSWWGAWLNSNPEKIVIVPKKWFEDKTKNTKDLIPANWVQL